jgi:hypothetical protein
MMRILRYFFFHERYVGLSSAMRTSPESSSALTFMSRRLRDATSMGGLVLSIELAMECVIWVLMGDGRFWK